MSVYQIAVFDNGSASHSNTLRATIEQRLLDLGIRFGHALLNGWWTDSGPYRLKLLASSRLDRNLRPHAEFTPHQPALHKSSYFRAASCANRRF